MHQRQKGEENTCPAFTDNMHALRVDEFGWFHAVIGAYVIDDAQGYINSKGVIHESLCVMGDDTLLESRLAEDHQDEITEFQFRAAVATVHHCASSRGRNSQCLLPANRSCSRVVTWRWTPCSRHACRVCFPSRLLAKARNFSRRRHVD